jgi:CRAL/TRIO domain
MLRTVSNLYTYLESIITHTFLIVFQSIQWRETWGANYIHDWEEPSILSEMCPHGLSGFDLDGSPILVVPFAGMDMWGLLHTVSKSDIIRMTLKMLEKYLNIAFQQSLKHGPQARQLVVLFDMENFNFKQYTWRPAAEVVISLIKMYEANYPEILKQCYVINGKFLESTNDNILTNCCFLSAPKIFSLAFNIVKKFLAEYTISKIQIFKSDRNKWLPTILSRISKDQLPVCYGNIT